MSELIAPRTPTTMPRAPAPAFSRTRSISARPATGTKRELYIRSSTPTLVGSITRLMVRKAALSRDPALRHLEFHPEFRTDNADVRRGLEQVLYDRHPGAKSLNGGFNKICPIRLNNPNFNKYMKAASDFMRLPK